MNKELQEYMDYIRKDYDRWSGPNRTDLTPIVMQIRKEMQEKFNKSLRAIVGSKYIKIVSENCVHSFIVKETGPKFKKGDILKAATYSAPTKNFARGNILTKTYGNTTWTGAM